MNEEKKVPRYEALSSAAAGGSALAKNEIPCKLRGKEERKCRKKWKTEL